MSGYRRFIAYVYEYQKGKKGSNCGFIKVEVRNQRCRIELHLHCPGLIPQMECQTYGFVRKDGLMNGILLGSCQTRADTVECTIETDSGNMADSGVSFGKIGGIVVLTQSGGFFGTEWDDQPVRPDNFREIKLPLPEPQAQPPADVAPNMTVEKQEYPNHSVSGEAPPMNDIDHAEMNTTDEIKPSDTGEIKTNDPDNIADTDNIDDTDSINGTDNINATDNIKEMPSEDTDANSDITSESAEEKSVPTSEISDIKNDSPTPAAAPVSMEEFSPFDDVEFVRCWKIQPADLMRCTSRVRNLRNNRFLQYGYYNFGHLLLAQRAGGRFVLGVPGGYDQQERFMANMFGFPCFKECRHIELPKNRGGYWYRLIDTPCLPLREDGIS